MSLSRTRRLRIVPGLLQTILQPNPAEKKMLPYWENLPMDLVHSIMEFANYKNRNGMFMSQIEKSDPRCLMLNGRVFWFSKELYNGSNTIFWWRNAEDRKKIRLRVRIQNGAITTLTIEFETYRRLLRRHEYIPNNVIKFKNTYVI
jgi:hypothetical protein